LPIVSANSGNSPTSLLLGWRYLNQADFTKGGAIHRLRCPRSWFGATYAHQAVHCAASLSCSAMPRSRWTRRRSNRNGWVCLTGAHGTVCWGQNRGCRGVC